MFFPYFTANQLCGEIKPETIFKEINKIKDAGRVEMSSPAKNYATNQLNLFLY